MNVVIEAVASLALGIFGWTFAEYALHNWRGHKGRGKNAFSREHLDHHRKANYFAPTSKKVRAAIGVFLVTFPIAALIGGWLFGAAFSAGFIAMYAYYEVLHRRLHTHPPRGFYGRWARRHHFIHHFKRASMNHGVTSPIWDIVFGTRAPMAQIRVPRSLAMEWLIDPVTNDVYTQYSKDYILAGGRTVDGEAA